MWWHGVCEILALLGTVAVVWRIFVSCHTYTLFKHGKAPIIPGYPVIGNTLSLALHGAAYIHRCREPGEAPVHSFTVQKLHKQQ